MGLALREYKCLSGFINQKEMVPIDIKFNYSLQNKLMFWNQQTKSGKLSHSKSFTSKI